MRSKNDDVGDLSQRPRKIQGDSRYGGPILSSPSQPLYFRQHAIEIEAHAGFSSSSPVSRFSSLVSVRGSLIFPDALTVGAFSALKARGFCRQHYLDRFTALEPVILALERRRNYKPASNIACNDDDQAAEVRMAGRLLLRAALAERSPAFAVIQLFPICPEIISKIINVRKRIFPIKKRPDVITADAVLSKTIGSIPRSRSLPDHSIAAAKLFAATSSALDTFSSCRSISTANHLHVE